MAKRSGTRRLRPGLALVLGAGLLAGALSSAVLGLSLAAFLLPLLFGMVVMGALLLLLSLVRQARALQRSRLLSEQPYSQDYTTFEGGCLGLLSAMGFKVQEVRALSHGGITVMAESLQPLTRGRYIIHCVESPEPLDALLVGDLYAEVVQGHALKGIYLTNASFTATAHEFAVSRNVELFDGQRLDELLRRYSAAAPDIPGAAAT